MLPGLLTATTATVAFLLICIQPAITTYLLPGTGGHPYLWHGTQVVFLLLLTCGYWLAGRLTTWMSLRAIGAGLIVLSGLAAIPLTWIAIEPVSVRSAVLFVAVATGPGFLALSMGSIGAQLTFLRAFPDRDPYWLYAASNAGSLIAAWSYVFLVEPAIDLSTQVLIWKVAVAAIYLVVGILLIASGRGQRGEQARSSAGPTAARTRARWTFAGLLPVALSLASTSYLTLHYGAQPSIWLGPFAAYLTTLAMAFTERGSRWLRPIARLAPIATVVAAIVLITPPTISIWLFVIHLVLVSVLLAGWNLRMASMRPEPGRLSSFYVHASIGGLAAALLTSMAAPLALNPALYPDVVLRTLRPLFATGAPEYFAVLAAGVVLTARTSSRLLTALALTLAAVTCIVRTPATSAVLYWTRSEFGQLVVTESELTRTITNGIVTHGYQATRCASGSDPITCVKATAYYGSLGPVGAVVSTIREQTAALRMLVVGLGAGTMGAYCELGDRLTFYELDPRVFDVADRFFSFLKRARSQCAGVRVSIGDGRLLAMEGAPASTDLIVMDAFSSDTVPMHLLTVEGLRGFTRLLADSGAVAVHVSNRYFDLVPVVGAGLRRAGLDTIAAVDPGAPDRYSSTWVIAARLPAILDRTKDRLHKAAIDVRTVDGGATPWTDERHSLLAVLRR